MSPPPPNQPRVVMIMRVFMCAAGTCGLRMCDTSEIPAAQKRGSSAAPGICARKAGENTPCTTETFTPTFSNTRPPRITAIVPPPPSPASASGRCHDVRSNRPAGRSAKGRAASTG